MIPHKNIHVNCKSSVHPMVLLLHTIIQQLLENGSSKIVLSCTISERSRRESLQEPLVYKYFDLYFGCTMDSHVKPGNRPWRTQSPLPSPYRLSCWHAAIRPMPCHTFQSPISIPPHQSRPITSCWYAQCHVQCHICPSAVLSPCLRALTR